MPARPAEVVLLSAALLLAAPAAARAHNLLITAKVHEGRIEVEAFYDDDLPADRAQVSLKDQAGVEVAAGLTDNAGKWTSPVLPPGGYTLTVDAGGGHRASKTLQLGTEPEAAAAGPSREELTSGRWVKIIIGVVAIIGFFVAFRLARRHAR
jgi:hypothetical protein